MKKTRIAYVLALLNVLVFGVPQAGAESAGSQAPINANLKEALALIPIPGIKDAMNGLVDGLRKGENGGYAAKTTVKVPGVGDVPLQLYFFGDGVKQALLLVVDRELGLPPVFNNKAWKALEGAALSDPIFSFSTVDFALDVRDMPADFRKVVTDSYFNVSSLNFTSGFQVASKIKLSGSMKKVIEHDLNFSVTDFTLRAGVVVPVPTDASGSASLAAQLAADMKNADKTLKDQPDFFVEFQPAPGTVLQSPLGMNQLKLTDATISLNYKLTLGLRGNILLPSGKKFITFFETPLTPLGVMDLGDFQFGMAAQTATLEDLALLTMAMNTPKVPGGSFIKGIDKYKDQLMLVLKPLSVFQMRNPNPVGEYKFGDITKPFPPKSAFNMLVLGPFASSTDSNGQTLSGPYFQALGDMTVLQQKMGSLRLTVGDSGLHGNISAGLNLKLGPLGKQGIGMKASADVDRDKQVLLMHGNVIGRTLDVRMDATSLSLNSPATCATPFELTQRISIQSLLDLSSLMDNLPGVNVDPKQISGCFGEELEKAYKWVATTGSSLGGYTAKAANAELNKIANQAEQEAKKAAEEAKKAEKAYNKAKDEAREKANQTSNSAMNAFNDAGNAFKKLGKKKKHKKGPDPKFAASVFDWDDYYDSYPDVVKAGVDLASHWKDHGFNEGRQGSLEFRAKFYLNRYLDVQQACGSDLQCALQHWLDHGIETGRQGSADFSVASYLDRYPDLQRAFGRENYTDALDHWINSGEDEGRDGSPASKAPGPISGPVAAGGDGGSAWSDRDQCASGYVTGFRLRYGKEVNTVQFRYSNGKWGDSHGYQSTDPWTKTESLPSGEYIVRVDYRSGGRLDNVAFITNRGKKYGPYGGGGGGPATYNVTSGEKLGCMGGRSGSTIDQLVFSSTGPR